MARKCIEPSIIFENAQSNHTTNQATIDDLFDYLLSKFFTAHN